MIVNTLKIEAYETNHVGGARMLVAVENGEPYPVPAICTLELPGFDTDQLDSLVSVIQQGYQFGSYPLGFDITYKTGLLDSYSGPYNPTINEKENNS